MPNTPLHSIEEIKAHFQQHEEVTYFISATNFNLMAIAAWVTHWVNVNFIDCYDGNNASVVVPEYSEVPVFKDIESINAFLLGNKKIVEQIKASQTDGKRVNAMFLFYDEALEAMVESLGMTLIMPPNKLVKHIDNKIVTTELGNSVDVPSVPNALTQVSSYSQLKEIMESAGLGDDVVIQTAYGDSGKTTFFIHDETSYQRVADKIEAEKQVKIMKRINCLQVAIEACTTRQGTYVGPILTEIIGQPELTPYPGGWCGNDINPGLFPPRLRETMVRYTESLGKALYEKGYRGYFEVDYLIDTANEDDMTVYLGELNPRVTGISALTNMSDFCRQTIPLFLFHLLEFGDTPFDLDPARYNRQVLDFVHPDFGQLVFKYTDETMKIVSDIPATGIYRPTPDGLSFLRYADHPGALAEGEIFLLRILSAGEYAYLGADILILFSRQQLQDAHNTLTPAARAYIAAVHDNVSYRELSAEEQQQVARYANPASAKRSASSE